MQLTNSLKTDLVKHLRPRVPVVVSPLMTVRQTVDRMQREGEGCVLICDENRTLLGIFTERDLLRRVIGERVSLDSPIKGVMSAHPSVARETEPATRALQVLHRGGLRHVPVVDDRNRPVGLVTVRGVMEYLVDHFPRTVYNQPPEAAALVSREGA